MKPMVNQSKRIAAQRSVPFENQVQLVFFDIHKPNTAIYIIPQPSAMSEQDRRAKVEQEVQKHIGLVRSCMKSVHGVTSSNEDDIYQAGLIALWQAVENFDESNGTKFSTYASVCIRREMCREIKNGKDKNDPICLDTLEQEAPDEYASLAQQNPLVLRTSSQAIFTLMLSIADTLNSEKEKKSVQAVAMYYQGYSKEQIFERLGLKGNSLSSFISVGRKVLQRHPRFCRSIANTWDRVQDKDYIVALLGQPFKLRLAENIFFDFPTSGSQCYEEVLCNLISQDNVAAWLLNKVRIGDSICIYDGDAGCTSQLTMKEDTIEVTFVSRTHRSYRKSKCSEKRAS